MPQNPRCVHLGSAWLWMGNVTRGPRFPKVAPVVTNLDNGGTFVKAESSNRREGIIRREQKMLCQSGGFLARRSGRFGLPASLRPVSPWERLPVRVACTQTGGRLARIGFFPGNEGILPSTEREYDRPRLVKDAGADCRAGRGNGESAIDAIRSRVTLAMICLSSGAAKRQYIIQRRKGFATSPKRTKEVDSDEEPAR